MKTVPTSFIWLSNRGLRFTCQQQSVIVGDFTNLLRSPWNTGTGIFRRSRKAQRPWATELHWCTYLPCKLVIHALLNSLLCFQSLIFHLWWDTSFLLFWLFRLDWFWNGCCLSWLWSSRILCLGSWSFLGLGSWGLLGLGSWGFLGLRGLLGLGSLLFLYNIKVKCLVSYLQKNTTRPA